jgi:hypothetical protein
MIHFLIDVIQRFQGGMKADHCTDFSHFEIGEWSNYGRSKLILR